MARPAATKMAGWDEEEGEKSKMACCYVQLGGAAGKQTTAGSTATHVGDWHKQTDVSGRGSG